MSMKTPAPVVLFVYRRPEHALRAIDALAKNPLASETDLIVYSDGPRDERSVWDVDEVRRVVSDIRGFRSVRLRKRGENWGLSKSLTAGVGEVLEEHKQAIILEDDLVVSKYFLNFVNDGLLLYEHDERVASIHGYCYPVRKSVPSTFFLRGADCWGWGTWSRAWSVYNPDSSELLRNLRHRRLARAFDFDGAFPFTSLLRAEAEGRVDSWAVRWYASAFLSGMYTLYPGQSMVQNIGTDGSGEHSGAGDNYRVDLTQGRVAVLRQPIEESIVAHRAFADFLRMQRPPMWRRAWRRMRRMAMS